jgi:GNAT superfamily N-acetyltransferase
MDITERNVSVSMERDNLDGIEDYPLPAGYAVRWYEPGYERHWVDIHLKAERYAEVSHEVYLREFGTDAATLRERQCFLFDSQEVPIATATAWYEDDYHGRRYGRVHWVAMIPEYQGQGLSKPLLALVLTRMAELGHDRVFLRTSTARLPAINLYARFGFVPSLRIAGDRDVWEQLIPRLRYTLELP